MKQLTIIIFSLFLFNCSKQKDLSFNLEKSLLKSNFIKIKMKKETTGHLLVKSIINGIESSLILDTGASHTVIDEKLKDKFKIQTELSDQVATGAGKTDIPMQNSYNNLLQIDSLKLRNRVFVLMNLDYVNDAIIGYGGEKVDGIIGADILADYEAIIDYSNLTLYLKNENINTLD